MSGVITSNNRTYNTFHFHCLCMLWSADKMGGMPLIEFILERENRSPIILCTICKLHIRYVFVWHTINFVISAKSLNRKFTHKWKLCHYLLTLMLVQPIWPSFVEILDLSFTNKIRDWGLGLSISIMTKKKNHQNILKWYALHSKPSKVIWDLGVWNRHNFKVDMKWKFTLAIF